MSLSGKTKQLKLIIIATLLATGFGFMTGRASDKVLKSGNVNYLSNTLIVKLKTVSSSASKKTVALSSDILSKMSPYSMKSANKVFSAVTDKTGNGIDRIVELKYASDVDPVYLAAKLKKSPDVEWAEPRYVYKANSTPNDQYYSLQWNLSKINAAQAWDVTKGDTNIIIGIVDTGTDWGHPDLAAHIWTNTKEIPGNGIDDDNNGYVDDVRGWDFGGLTGTADNDPTEDQADHGTHVAGIASAVTDNDTGIASIGYNSKLMIVKTCQNNYRDSNDSPYVVYGYEGIVYAVDNGAKIINCSWGGGGYSISGEEVIKYALANGVLIVAAAGNESTSADSYPACYPGVLSVGSTDPDDKLSYFSNYGKKLGVCAPGRDILSTWLGNRYAYLSGTSMASPLVAGLASLVAAQFPKYNPYQIAEQIRVNSDNIDNLNPTYQYLLGRGRVNAYKAVSTTNSKSVRAVDVQISDAAPGGNGNGLFESGETVTIKCKFVNYLNPVSALTVTLENENSYSTIKKSSFSAGAVATLDTVNNYSSTYEVVIGSGAPQDATLNFKLNYSDGAYSDFQWISIPANPSYSTQSGNNIALTITSKGNLGFNDYSANLQGAGLKYNNSANFLFEGSLMLATSALKVSDGARNGIDGSAEKTSFTTVQPFTLAIPGSVADFEGSTIFNDKGASSPIGVTVKMNSYSFTNDADKDFIILRYKLINNGLTTINNLYAGLFMDFDMVAGSGTGDSTAYDAIGHFGYARHPIGAPAAYIATALISSDKYGYWGILNNGADSADGGFSTYDGFSDHEKWKALSSGIGKAGAGMGDISEVTSAGAFSIAAMDSIEVAFAIAGGYSIASLRTTVTEARSKYQQVIAGGNTTTPTKFSLSQNRPNPFNPSTKIKYTVEKASRVSIKVYDLLGREVAVLLDEYKPAGSYSVEFRGISSHSETLSSGVYFYRLQAGGFTSTKKMILLR